jgi:hypothetical protein
VYRGQAEQLTRIASLHSSVKTRIQADVGSSQKAKAITAKEGKPTMKKGASLMEGMMTIVRSKEGVKGLYRGFGASMVNTFSTRKSLAISLLYNKY